MTTRRQALETIEKRTQRVGKFMESPYSLQFASDVFHLKTMELVFPKKVFESFKNILEGKETLDLELANLIGEGLKEWSMKKGATHFAHWFQPLTRYAAQKHDSFLTASSNGKVVEKLQGKDLVRGEPDASSFPSGGLRSTHEARGYTVWDVSSPPFLMKGAGGLTLYIPSLFFSWTGFSLDYKIPLLRAEKKLSQEVIRLFSLAKRPVGKVFSNLGIEQEYFLIDQNWFFLRQDLLLTRRTLLGSAPSKGQQTEEHYCSHLNQRVLGYMREFEEEAIRLGIPVKTRHAEVAPSQYETAPLFEPVCLAIDHNLLMMQLMQEIAEKHHLRCLFHEKPFAQLNGSGKHSNWSLSTDEGVNLLDPKESTPFIFMTLLTAILRAVYEHGGLLRCSVASRGNDLRLGGHEAPPAIPSVYLGAALEEIMHEYLSLKAPGEAILRKIDLGLSQIGSQVTDAADRNRTSFFAFTGNKFELRAVGASQHVGFPMMVLQAIVADALKLILDEIADVIGDRVLDPDQIAKESFPVLQRHLIAAKSVVFHGNGYSRAWEEEANQRGLVNIPKSFYSFFQLLEHKSIRALEGVCTEEEIRSRHQILIEQYVKQIEIEARVMVDLVQTQIIPALMRHQKEYATSLQAMKEIGIEAYPNQQASLQQVASLMHSSFTLLEEFKKVLDQAEPLGWEAKGQVFSDVISVKMEELREHMDRLEKVCSDPLWPLPKYWEMLFIL